MATIGRGQYDHAVFEFFDGLRSYDPKRAVSVLAEDADFQSPWSGHLTGKASIEAFLKAWLSDPAKRPSFTIIDIAGDGAVARFKVSVSGRFGKGPQHLNLDALCLQHVVHQVKFSDPHAKAHH